MKFALHNPYTNKAENQSSVMIAGAAKRLGHEAKEFRLACDIERYQPDFVISMSHILAKETNYPTFGHCLNPIYYCQMGDGLENLLTYDGYLTASSAIKGHLQKLLVAAKKEAPIFFYHTTSPKLPDGQTQINFKEARLAYFGTNWDRRYRQVFKSLSRYGHVDFYGPAQAWDFIESGAYKGSVPFTENAVIDVYRRSGVGLCLFNRLFIYDDLPSSRIFETVSAGALAITSRMPFIENHFGDSVLYIEPLASPSELVRQIDRHMQWVFNHPEQARDMARASQKIFFEQLNIDILLARLISDITNWQSQRTISKSRPVDMNLNQLPRRNYPREVRDSEPEFWADLASTMRVVATSFLNAGPISTFQKIKKRLGKAYVSEFRSIK